MASEIDREECAKRCWQIGGAAAVVAFLLLWLVTPMGFLKALLVGILGFVAVGLGLIYTRCQSQPEAVKPTTKVAEVAKPAPKEPEVSPTAEAPTRSSPPTPANDAHLESAPTPAEEPAPAIATGTVKPSVALPGQQELAGRKGTWVYSPSAAAAEPRRLSEARSEGADDLKQIKGVGPKLEALLNGMGFYHFDQIAGWTEAEIAWVDENLDGFKGRVSRDDWVAQAKALAGGGA